ncbi:MAG: SDR family oxidoreductase [Pseudomonadota bacterium]
MMGRLTGKTAIVTGAASGIGRATAEALSREGAAVYATDLDGEGATRCAAAITENGGRAMAAHQDVLDEVRWNTVVEEAAALGDVSVLVNNAGIALGGALVDFSLEDWRTQMAVNLDSVFLGTRAAVRAMKDTGGGSIINLSSVAGLRGASGLGAYCASKGGVRLFTKSAAVECGQMGYNIRVNSVHPGIIDTPIWGKNITGVMSASPDPEAMREGLFAPGGNAINAQALGAASAVLGRPGTADEVAEVIVFLASDDSRYCTGQEFVVDGGMTARS